MGAIDLIFSTLSHNVSFMGKTWWLSMLASRALLVLLTGFTLFADDQSRFVCNTVQPGCSNVCFDAFAPVCVLHLWLFHCVLLCLPHVLFAAYVAHKVLSDPACGSRRGSPFTLETSVSSRGRSVREAQRNDLPRGCATPRFCCAYVLTVVLRILLEVLFAAGQFLTFGLSVPRSFLCHEAPCTSGVECYVSKPTEKTLMLNFMLGVSSMSVLLSVADLASSVKAMGRWRTKRSTLTEEVGEAERSGAFTAEDADVVLTRRIRPSGSSNVAANDGVHAAGGSRGEPPDTEALSVSTAPTDESACDRFRSPALVPAHPNLHNHLRGAPPNPRGPPLVAVKNPGQESESADSPDKRAWV